MCCFWYTGEAAACTTSASRQLVHNQNSAPPYSLKLVPPSGSRGLNKPRHVQATNSVLTIRSVFRYQGKEPMNRPRARYMWFAVVMLRPGLSRRQRRRRYEDVYWSNVHINAILRKERRERRMDKLVLSILSEAEATNLSTCQGS